ncbi:MAG: hypothetical protein EBR08_01350 [Bacteroidia bacterium]|nr:hypothetical protein [Bacteroidia bacterium]
MKKLPVKITLFLFRVLMGIIDTVMPNVKASIRDNGRCPITKKNEFKIDWTRLISAAITFLFLVLHFFGLISVEQLNWLKTLGK